MNNNVYARVVFALVLFLSFPVFSQIEQPVTWEFSSSVKSGDEAQLIFRARLEKGWHVYSQQPGHPDVIPTTFEFIPSSDYERIDSVMESNTVKKMEPVFDSASIVFFENEAVFTQKIKIKGKGPFTVKGKLNFMTCNDTQCLPPEDVDFEIKIDPGAAPKEASESLWVIILLSFFGGFAALITPCVFPMIPLTVSFFTKQSGNRKKGVTNAILYGACIVFIYVSLGLVITAIWGGDALNAMSANEWMNLFFFIIFVIFGISFLGAFEIRLPNSWINKADKASEKGGLLGIFFMAFTLALVSFSCTGPIVGLILGGASVSGNYLSLALGMLSFSLALALPFVLFALFPTWLTSLPKSGGWLNTVKVFLGLIELAFSLKFLSVTDLQGLHIDFLDFHINGPLGILKREIFITLWIVLFAFLGFYMLGKIRFAHDNHTYHVSIPKFFISLLSFAFVVYLIPGLWGAPLKLISGFTPPSFYTEGWTPSTGAISVPAGGAVVSHKQSCPHNLNCFHDFDEAMAEAKKTGKPLMVDFTGWACVNCRKMEENVWSDPEVLRRLSNDYVLVSLYVDERTELPDDQKTVSKTTGKKIRTVGNKWSDFQVSRFGRNSQPWYELLDHEGNQLTETGRGYDPCISCYTRFLDEGKAAFEKRKK